MFHAWSEKKFKEKDSRKGKETQQQICYWDVSKCAQSDTMKKGSIQSAS